MTRLAKLIRRFCRDEQGNLVVEAVMVMPALIWAYVAMFAYWDSYQSINNVQKASYTVSDLISRQQASVNSNFINGMRGTMNYILGSPDATKLRVTSFRWSQPNNRYEVIWSQSPGNAMSVQTNATMAGLISRLPIMSDGDSAVLIETHVDYTPPTHYGMEATTIKQFIVTRPRYLPKICHTSFSCA